MKTDDTEQKPVTAETETGTVTVKTPVAAPKTAPAPKKTSNPPAKKARTTGAKKMAKTAKKAKKAPKAKKASGGSRITFHKDDVIMVTTKKNPRKEGTNKYKQYDLLIACHGKTVGEFDKRKGDRGALLSMIKRERGHVKKAKIAA